MSAGEAHDHFTPGHEHKDYAGDKFGMWLFLFTELILFGGMFLALMVYMTGEYKHEFHVAATNLNVFMGAGNTVVLLTSSLTMVWAITALQKGSKFWSLFHIALTIALALTFMVVKYFEWTAKFHHHIFPPKITALANHFGPSDLGRQWTKEWKESGMDLHAFNHVYVDTEGNEKPEGFVDTEHKYSHHRYSSGQVLFFGLYFTMTGLHGFHVLIGVVLLLWMMKLVKQDVVTGEEFGMLENVGLYWHVVDLIWIYLFPLFYLVA